MSQRRSWHVRLAFEPNRYASQQLVKVYEQLNPMEPYAKPAHASGKPARKKRSSAKENRT